MQIRIIIFITILLIFSGCTSGTKQLNDGKKSHRVPANTKFSSEKTELLERFLNITKMQQGEYALIKGPESCQEGELRALTGDNEINVMLGAHLLIVGLGRHEFEFTERECTSKVSSEFGPMYFKGLKTTSCLGFETVMFDVDAKIKGNTFEYSRVVKTGKKITFKEHCILKKQ